jgi:hypothetical protein
MIRRLKPLGVQNRMWLSRCDFHPQLQKQSVLGRLKNNGGGKPGFDMLFHSRMSDVRRLVCQS